jgi:uncharacterized protein YnzC (UPF0291/DUF896 family)
MAEYFWDDKVEKRVEDNNRLFGEITEYVMNLRDQVNTQLRQTSVSSNNCLSNYFKREGLSENSEGKETLTQKSIDMILSNMKSYFEQVLHLQVMDDVPTSKHFPKHIETII